MVIEIPGVEPLEIVHIVFDYNGTLARDGRVQPTTADLLAGLAQQYRVTILTADTFGTAGNFAKEQGLAIQIITGAQDKETYVQSLKHVAAVGNGVNDQLMFRAADLAIAVLGDEGLAVAALTSAHIVVPSIDRAIELFAKPKRLVATLRP